MSDFNETLNTESHSQSIFGQSDAGQPVKPDNYLVLAIIATVLGLCSCIGTIIGIVAIVFATQVDSKYNLGDYAGAESASKNAKLLSIISLVIAGLGIIGSIIYYAVVGAAIMSQYV